MHFPHKLFKTAGLNSTDVANLCDVSRITGYRWLQGVNRNGTEGVGVNLFLRDRVTKRGMSDQDQAQHQTVSCKAASTALRPSAMS